MGQMLATGTHILKSHLIFKVRWHVTSWKIRTPRELCAVTEVRLAAGYSLNPPVSVSPGE